MRRQNHQFGAVYNAPTCDVPCRVDVRVEGDITGCASECFAVANPKTKASRTSLACVRGVNALESDSAHRGFVGHELLELEEAPERHHTIQVLVRNLNPIANSFEGFHTDQRTSNPNSFRDDCFRNLVIRFGDTLFLLPGEPPENSFSPPTPVGLKRSANTPTLFTIFTKGCSVELCPRGCDGDIANTKIDSENASWNSVRDFSLNLDVDKESVVFFYKSGRGRLLIHQRFPLVVSDVECGFDAFSARYGERNYLTFERKRPLIKSNKRRLKLELATHLCGFEGSGASSNCGNGKISRKVVLLSNVVVKGVMQANRIRLSIVSTPLSNFSAGFGVSKKEIVQNRNINRIDGEFTSDGSDHLHGLSVWNAPDKHKSDSPPPPKSGGIRIARWENYETHKGTQMISPLERGFDIARDAFDEAYFGKVIGRAIQGAIDRERERCAKMAEDFDNHDYDSLLFSPGEEPRVGASMIELAKKIREG